MISAVELSRQKTSKLEQSRGLFLESLETFRAYSGDIILFVSSKRRRFEARNFAVIFMFIAFTAY